MTTPDTSSVTRTFEVAGPLDVTIEIETGSVLVTAGDVTEATVSLAPRKPGDEAAAELIARSRIDLRGTSLRIDVPRSDGLRGSARQVGFFWDGAPIDVEVTVPSHSAVTAKAGSADIALDGTYGDVELKSGSGTVRLDEATDARVVTGSGDVQVGAVGSLLAKSGSGDISVERSRADVTLSSGSGDLAVLDLGSEGSLSTASGDVEVGTSSGELGIKTASGDATVRRADAGEITIKTATGSATVGVAEGTAVLLDCSSVTGQVRSELDPGTEPPTDDTPRLAVQARSVSGSVTLRRA